MNFREYYRLHEDRTYILMKNKLGKYEVISAPNSPQQLPQAMQAAKHANNPQGMWTYSISSGGDLHLPPELTADKEPILQAHYNRMGLNKMPTPDPKHDDESEYFDPDVFNPEYGRTAWKPYKKTASPSEPGTEDYGPKRVL